ncbi:uncharacterized protein N7483_002880 [Penicillium malachiteum]|uniref:uncharacterized protein n=1 Tax=Penicillium malachiteum TaxID=1324776 RepID=UPI0025497F6A|nr:uncharacterized protein N7483_002880 [Penicillium malachiteum]KAJ5737755.1 hypothetical protein N7483_002880 [Penicillium malachiteum]
MEDLKSQATSVSTHSIEPAELDELLDDLAPVFFPVIRPTPGHAPDIRKPGIIRDEIDKPEGVHSYKIDEVGNVRVKQYHKDVDLKTTPRENDVLLHHQDPDLMLKVIMGQLQHYHYEQDRQFHQWATEGRLVTRLIDIEPGDLDDKMRIAIRIVDLKQSPHYKALSYTWKETAYERAIQPQWSPDDVEAARKMARVLHAVYCDDPSGNERFLEINCGLRDALRRFRHKSETRTYWVDQISINQSNPSERAYQVSGMQFFFNRASEVTLCIGEEEKDTSEVFAVLETIAKEFKRLGFPPNPDQIVANPQSNLPPFESHVWVSVLNLFDRPVFNRCWVIQEVVTAQKLILYCGSFCIEWADLSKVGQTLCQKSWYPRLPQGRLRNKYTGLITSSSDPQPQGIEMPGFNTVVVMNDLRDQFHTLKRNPLESLLYTTFTFEASDPRDKVYSLLGVRSARISSSDPHWIKADYEKSVNEVFLNAAKVCILESSSFAICGINNGPSSRSIDELPSWVPDLTAKGIDHLTSFCRPHPSSPYSACGDIPIITAWPYEEHPDLLVTSSCKIETIASVSEHFFEDMESFSNLIMEWSSMASRIGPRYPTGEFTPDAFRRTCVADVTGPYRYGPMPERLNIPFIKLIERFFYHHISVEVDRGEKTLDDILSESWNPVITDLMTDLFRMEDALKSIEEDSNEGSSADDVTAGIANRFGMPSSPIDSALLEDIVLA